MTRRVTPKCEDCAGRVVQTVEGKMNCRLCDAHRWGEIAPTYWAHMCADNGMELGREALCPQTNPGCPRISAEEEQARLNRIIDEGLAEIDNARRKP